MYRSTQYIEVGTTILNDYAYIYFFYTWCCMLWNYYFFFFNDPATPEIYPLPLHDALPISRVLLADAITDYLGRNASRIRSIKEWSRLGHKWSEAPETKGKTLDEVRPSDIERYRERRRQEDRKSTRLNSSHSQISYAVFCCKKKRASGQLQMVRHYSAGFQTSSRRALDQYLPDSPELYALVTCLLASRAPLYSHRCLRQCSS